MHAMFSYTLIKCCDRYTGMLEAIRVRKEGYAYRPFFSDFVYDYRSLAFHYTDKVNIIIKNFNMRKMLQNVKLSRENCEKILAAANISGWRIGKSRVCVLKNFYSV